MAGGEEGPSSSGGGDNTNGKYPLGFRFKPTDQEVVEFYLLPKLQDKPTVPNDVIIEDDVYSCDPEILTQKYKDKGEGDTWYFLSPRIRKYQKGDRPSRRTADDRGRWKPSTGKSEKCSDLGEGEEEEAEEEEELCSNGAIKFCVTTLAYHQGPAIEEEKTKWLMREYTLPEYEIEVNSSNPGGANMKLDRYAMCKIYTSPLKKWRTVKTGTASEEAAAFSPMLEIGEGTAPPTPSSKEQAAGKRPAAKQQPLGRATAANKRARQSAPSKVQPAPVHNNGGGAAGYHIVPGKQAPVMPWPPVVSGNRLQGAVQRTYQHNGRPVQRLAGWGLRPPVSAHNPLGRAMLMRPPPSPGFQQQKQMTHPQNGSSMAAGQMLRPPPATVMRPPPSSDFQQQKQMAHPQNGLNMAAGQMLPPPPATVMRPPPSRGFQQQKQMLHPQNGPNTAAGQMLPPPPAPQPPHRLQKMDPNDPESHRVMALLLDALRKPESRHLLESCGVQQQSLMALDLPPQPTDANHTATASFMAPYSQLSAPHSGGQHQQQQQRSSGSAIPATSAPGGTEATTASGKLLVPRGAARGGSGKGGARQQ